MEVEPQEAGLSCHNGVVWLSDEPIIIQEEKPEGEDAAPTGERRELTGQIRGVYRLESRLHEYFFGCLEVGMLSVLYVDTENGRHSSWPNLLDLDTDDGKLLVCTVSPNRIAVASSCGDEKIRLLARASPSEKFRLLGDYSVGMSEVMETPNIEAMAHKGEGVIELVASDSTFRIEEEIDVNGDKLVGLNRKETRLGPENSSGTVSESSDQGSYVQQDSDEFQDDELDEYDLRSDYLSSRSDEPDELVIRPDVQEKSPETDTVVPSALDSDRNPASLTNQRLMEQQTDALTSTMQQLSPFSAKCSVTSGSASPSPAAPTATPTIDWPTAPNPAVPVAPEPTVVPLAPKPTIVPPAPKPTAIPLAPKPTAIPLAPKPTAIPLAPKPTVLSIARKPTVVPTAPNPAVPVAPEPMVVPLAPKPTVVPLAPKHTVFSIARKPVVPLAPKSPFLPAALKPLEGGPGVSATSSTGMLGSAGGAVGSHGGALFGSSSGGGLFGNSLLGSPTAVSPPNERSKVLSDSVGPVADSGWSDADAAEMDQLISCMSDRINSLCDRVRKARSTQLNEIMKGMESRWATAQALIKESQTRCSLVSTDVNAVEMSTECMRSRLAVNLAAQDTVSNIAHGAPSSEIDQYLTDVRRSANLISATLQQTEICQAALDVWSSASSLVERMEAWRAPLAP